MSDRAGARSAQCRSWLWRVHLWRTHAQERARRHSPAEQQRPCIVMRDRATGHCDPTEAGLHMLTSGMHDAGQYSLGIMAGMLQWG